MAITDLDEIRAQNTFDMIDASTLEPKTKSELKESVAEAKQNLNGRSLEERCASIARNQFDTTRFLADIIIQFKNVADDVKKDKQPQKTWKDVIIKCAWPICFLGTVALVCSIFQPQIVSILTAVVKLF